MNDLSSKGSCEVGNELCRGATRIVPKNHEPTENEGNRISFQKIQKIIL